MTPTQKIEHAVLWFKSLSRDRQETALRELLDHSIRSEWVNVWSPQDRVELIQEAVDAGKSPVSAAIRYEAPYLTTCGEPLA